MSDAAPAIEVRDVAKIYRGGAGPVHALETVTLTVARGEFVSVVGPSGCGKSTLLLMVAGLLPPSHGRIVVEGTEVRQPFTDLGIVFQNPVLLEWRTVLDNVLIQMEFRRLDRARCRQRALDLLGSVGLGGFEHRHIWELSGGMKQRVALCRALVHDPALLLMDEPFGALDALTRAQLNLDLQYLWSATSKTVLFVTHGIDEAVFLSDRVIVMSPRPGRIEKDVKIELPRPRALALRDAPEFTAYVREIRAIFEARGVLQERAPAEPARGPRP